MYGTWVPGAALHVLLGLWLALLAPPAVATVTLTSGQGDDQCKAQIVREHGRPADIVSAKLSTYGVRTLQELPPQLVPVCNCALDHKPCVTLAAPSTDGGSFYIDCAAYDGNYDCCEDTWQLLSGRPLTSKPCKLI